MNKETEEYERIVSDAFKKKSEFYIYNNTKDHAAVILKELVNNTKKEILLFTGCDENFFKETDIIKMLTEKSKSSEIEIKFILDCENTSEFQNKIKKAGIKCKLYKLENKVESIKIDHIIERNGYEKIKHFVVSDGEAFRAEVPHEPSAENVSAIASAKNPKTAEFLVNIFNHLTTNRFAIPMS